MELPEKINTFSINDFELSISYIDNFYDVILEGELCILEELVENIKNVPIDPYLVKNGVFGRDLVMLGTFSEYDDALTLFKYVSEYLSGFEDTL